MSRRRQSLHWNRLERTSVGLPVVGMGQWKALWASSGSEVDCKARLLTLPALMLRRLLLRFRLPLRRSEFFFLRVLLRTGNCWSSPALKLWTEAARCMLEPETWWPSTMEEPRWEAPHSSVKRPTGCGCCGCGTAREWL